MPDYGMESGTLYFVYPPGKFTPVNVKAFIDAVMKAKPSGAKGNYMKKISISSTMGPGVKISLASVGAGGAV